MKKSFYWLGTLLSVAIAVLLVVPGQTQNPPQLREYWIAAEEILWDYAPSFPINRMTGQPFNEDQLVFVGDGPDRIGRIYRKAVFRSYTPNFGRVIDGPNEVLDPQTGEMRIIRKAGTPSEHLGILGPIIRAEVGDRVNIHFRNQTRFNLSLHPHGFFYSKDNEGTPYEDGTTFKDKGDDAVPPGQSYTYTWLVPDRAGPGPNDPNSIVWPYHSHANEVADTNAGLVGAIVVHKRGTLESFSGLPLGIDREFINLFTVFDENSSLYIDANIEEFVEESVDPTLREKSDEDFVESNLMHGINGLLYADLKGMTIAQGEQVRWYLLAMGTEVDIHTPHWHGETLLYAGHRTDITEIFPASAKTLDMIADDPGTWMYHCHVNDHLNAGMMTLFTVEPIS